MLLVSHDVLIDLERRIKDAIGGHRYDFWFSRNVKWTVDDQILRVGVPNRFYREWFETHFQATIQAEARHVLGPVTIRYEIDPTLFQLAQQENARRPEPTPLAAPAAVIVRKPRGKYVLDKFVVGANNRLAQSACRTIIESPKHAGFSFLTLYGDAGLGKTHLLKAMEAELNAGGQVKAVYISGEEFTNQFLEAMQGSKLTQFRRKFRHCDVLLVDDVQFLAGKKATLGEFLATLTAIEHRGGLVAMAAPQHPRRLPTLTEDVITRLVSGMVAKIEAPNFETRRQIVAVKAADRCLTLDQPVVDFLAHQFNENVFALEGAINYLEHYADTHEVALTLPIARTALADQIRHAAVMHNVGDIKLKACKLFGIAPQTLMERCRSRSISHPRMFVLYLARKHTNATYSTIGEEIGKLNHSTVIAAEKKVLSLLAKDEEIQLGEKFWKAREAVEEFNRFIGGQRN